MAALSLGFCASALVQSLSATDFIAWQQAWSKPTLQVVDIQRYPRFPSVASGSSRFYVAVSDGQTLVWLVVPPRTPLENAIAAFDVAIGCRVTLLSYTLVTAANGLNVVVPAAVAYSSHTQRLLGHPTFATAGFEPSPQSLLHFQDAESVRLNTLEAARETPHPITNRDFMDAPQKALGNWCISIRVAWKGREFPLQASSHRFGGSGGLRRSGTAVSGSRVVFRCLVVDANGDGVIAAFFGGEALVDHVQLDGCYRLSHGTVKWGVGESGVPVELHFTEQSVEEEEREEVRRGLPHHATNLVGEVAQQLQTVSKVISEAKVGEYVSVVGMVTAVDGHVQIATKRGRVWRCVITLCDEGTGDAAPQREAAHVEMTLWGDVADSVTAAPGQRWLFHPCAVQTFQHRKTLSSRASTMAIQLSSRSESCLGVTPSVSPSKKSLEGHERCTEAMQETVAPLMNPLKVALDLAQGTPTLPVLVRLQEMSRVYLSWKCDSCGASRHTGSSLDGESQDVRVCCGSAELFPELCLRALLSDGLSKGIAVFHGSTVASLLRTSFSELISLFKQKSSLPSELWGHLIGTSLLIWRLPDRASAALEDTEYTVTRCRHVEYRSGSETLISAIEGFSDHLEESEPHSSGGM